MEDEIVMTENQLKAICVPRYQMPEELTDESEEIRAVFHLSWPQVSKFAEKGMAAIPEGRNPMMKITKISSLTSGRTYGESIIRAEMSMGNLNTSVSIEVSKIQLEQIIKLGMQVQFGAMVNDVKILSMSHYDGLFDLGISIKGKV